MSLSTAVIFITIVLYLFITLGVGVHFSKTNKNTDDFYLGGRKLGPLVTAMSAEASVFINGIAWTCISDRIM